MNCTAVASRRTLYSLLALAAVIVLAEAPAQTTVTGAGSTFVYPILAKWSEVYRAKSGVSINYQSIGSGAGIAQIKKGTVDFGASDMPLKPEELNRDGLTQFPLVIGGAVPVVNLQGIAPGQLKLTGPVLADIYLGKVTKWNDSAIVRLNKGLKLPAQDISVIHRSDGSGTTFIWTNYLSKVSAEWKSKVGEGTSVDWPVGVGGKGNEGVSANVQQITGAIGYVEYAYALQNKLTDVQMQNAVSEFVHANAQSFAAAAAGADWSHAPGFYVILTSQTNKGAWPITGSVFILMRKVQAEPPTAREILKFFTWAYSEEGTELARSLDYVPLPAGVVKQVQMAWKTQLKDATGKPVWQ
jgi:phosphate transport system substrate-binding protein